MSGIKIKITKKVSQPQGTRDFDAITVRKRQYIFNTIKTVFELFGFQPLETPAMENMETLMGKYGDEGDKLIFRILNSGNPFPTNFFRIFLNMLNDEDKKIKADLNIQEGVHGPFEQLLTSFNPDVLDKYLEQLFENKRFADKYLPDLKPVISEKALRYDLTIPFARYVAMNHGQLTFPFKRYQMQPVWRADRPQRGRYREFYQCDADVVGSKSLWNEIELISIYAEVFLRLKIPVEIKINNRKIFAALADRCGGEHLQIPIATAIDKVEKIGIIKVLEELSNILSEDKLNIVRDFLAIDTTFENGISQLKFVLKNSTLSSKAYDELNKLFEIINGSGLFQAFKSYHEISFDPRLARGLSYYTGAIFEVKAKNVQMGSIGGGGRYDNLTGTFGVPDIAGVGISFGVDRIYDVMEELNLFPTDVNVGTQVLFFNLGENEAEKAFELMQQLRANGIRCELFHEKAKFDKQFKYADKKAIPYSIFIGEKELLEKNCVVKDLRNGIQETVALEALKDFTFIA